MPPHRLRRTQRWSQSVTYASQSWSGEEFLDDVTLSGLVISGQSIGVASSSTGFEKGIDGILGVGPVDLSSGTTSGGGTVPTVLDNLYYQETITEEVLGVYFIPASESGTGAYLWWL
jgi:saccharopepsin